ncbi:hypothetical protein [Candidatus Nitrotoga arctica]|uniref:Uncharacterized protein n=1 Tax=Candidatus Nitrotoga arctica TaxID=453162 RepID=A0ABM8YX54_9PROT|nr:hypothetical protein [Candidatus Nitrotoga arctica]CAG9932069.1 protein of unknown function [Candidatus Nitrotoga arctica]
MSNRNGHYEQVTCGDCIRILICLLLPQGVDKMDTALDKYVKNSALNPALWERFGHDPALGVNFVAAMRENHTYTPIYSRPLRAMARLHRVHLCFPRMTPRSA